MLALPLALRLADAFALGEAAPSVGAKAAGALRLRAAEALPARLARLARLLPEGGRRRRSVRGRHVRAQREGRRAAGVGRAVVERVLAREAPPLRLPRRARRRAVPSVRPCIGVLPRGAGAAGVNVAEDVSALPIPVELDRVVAADDQRARRRVWREAEEGFKLCRFGGDEEKVARRDRTTQVPRSRRASPRARRRCRRRWCSWRARTRRRWARRSGRTARRLRPPAGERAVDDAGEREAAERGGDGGGGGFGGCGGGRAGMAAHWRTRRQVRRCTRPTPDGRQTGCGSAG